MKCMTYIGWKYCSTIDHHELVNRVSHNNMFDPLKLGNYAIELQYCYMKYKCNGRYINPMLNVITHHNFIAYNV